MRGSFSWGSLGGSVLVSSVIYTHKGVGCDCAGGDREDGEEDGDGRGGGPQADPPHPAPAPEQVPGLLPRDQGQCQCRKIPFKSNNIDLTHALKHEGICASSELLAE